MELRLEVIVLVDSDPYGLEIGSDLQVAVLLSYRSIRDQQACHASE